jgi:hypothetical protein
VGLVSGKVIIALLILFVGLGWSIANGYIRWETDQYKCYYGKGYQAVVPQQRLMTLGKLHLYYQPLSWDCPKDQKYDIHVYKMQNGELVPLPSDTKP